MFLLGLSRSEEVQLGRIRRREEEERAKERDLMLNGKLKPDQAGSIQAQGGGERRRGGEREKDERGEKKKGGRKQEEGVIIVPSMTRRRRGRGHNKENPPTFYSIFFLPSHKKGSDQLIAKLKTLFIHLSVPLYTIS